MSVADALDNHDRGYHPIPLPKMKKSPVPPGLTGYAGRNLTRSEIETGDWSGNMALQLPPGVIGIDVDNYNGKKGAQIIADLEAELGALPPAPMLHSGRRDGSGIRIFKVPVDTMLRTAIVGGVEFIQWFHRYAMAPPSLHPEGRLYGCTDSAGEEIDYLPPIDELPELPWRWTGHLAAEGKGRKAAAVATQAELLDFLDNVTESNHPEKLQGIRTQLDGLSVDEHGQPGGRHDTAVGVACWAAREALAGFFSGKAAVDLLAHWWLVVTGGGREAELASILLWALAEAKADPERVEAMRSDPYLDTGKPKLLVSGRHLDDIVTELDGLLVASNNPPTLFSHAEGVSLLDGARLQPLDPIGLLDVAEHRIRPVKIGGKESVEKPATVSLDVRRLALRRLRDELPKIVGLAPAPFMRPDGSVCTNPGYDTATRLYLLDSVGVDVPDKPNAKQVESAVAVIDELLYDFPLPTPADRAHAFSALITPAIRHLVPLAPLHYVNGNTAGVGKNLLIESLLWVHLGERVRTDPLPTDEEEMRKQITSLLAEGRRVVLWDEAHYLIGKQLARLLTSPTWGDRMLGVNITINADNLASCYALGNNGEIVGDLRRRVIRINLSSELEQPSRRSGFRHADLRAWVAEHRSELLSAVLTLLRAWHCAGRPGIKSPLGSFEAWADVVGGTLDVAGVDGFLDNVNDVLEDGDYLDAEFTTHVHDLAELFAGREFTAGQVIEMYRSGTVSLGRELPSGIRPFADDAGERLGKLYRRYHGRVMPGGVKLVKSKGQTHGRKRWSVTK